MNFYKRYIGDYGRKTAHLSLLEHGAYAVLLDHYYGTRKPLPDDMPALYRICRAVDKQEQAAVQRVVTEFFPLGADGLRHNPRADQEIAEAAAFADAQAMRAHKRWHKQADKPGECPDDASHSHSHSQNPEAKTKKKRGRERHAPFPESFPLTADLIAYAESKGIRNRKVVETFHENFILRHGERDYPAKNYATQWKRWMLNDIRDGKLHPEPKPVMEDY